jgi:phage-related protein
MLRNFMERVKVRRKWKEEEMKEVVVGSTVTLFALQFIVQLLMIIVRCITGEKRNTLLRWGRNLIGLAENFNPGNSLLLHS